MRSTDSPPAVGLGRTHGLHLGAKFDLYKSKGLILTSFDRLRPLVAAETALLAPTLYEAVSSGVDGARTRMRGVDPMKYPAQFSGLVRMEVREDLETRALPPGWLISGDPRKMAQLLLLNVENNIILRFLKENRNNVGGVPHAGTNLARRDVWSRRATQLSLDLGEDYPDSLSEPTTFLLLWAPVDRSNLDLGFTLRLVHTIEPGDHVRGVICDMEIELQQGGTIFDHLAFAGSDESGDLFMVDIAEENDDE